MSKIKISITRPLSFKINNKREDFKPGIHEVEDEILEHWYTGELIQNGDLTVLDVLEEKEVDESKVVEVEIKEELSDLEKASAAVIKANFDNKEIKKPTLKLKRMNKGK